MIILPYLRRTPAVHPLAQEFSAGRLGVNSANRNAQSAYGLCGRKSYGEFVLGSATDYRVLLAILSDPNNSFGIHKDFLAVHIFKHHKLHVSSVKNHGLPR